jgi:hypothetical protein
MQSIQAKTKVVSLILVLSLLGVILISSKTTVQAQTPDSIERAAAICVENGGRWDGTQRTCFEDGPCQLRESLLGIPTWYKYLDREIDESGKCSVVLGGSDTEGKANSILPIGIAVLEAMLRISGLVAVVMVFWGGFKYITAQGNPDNAKGARTTIINAMIGLVIVILSTAIVSFIGRSI